MQKIILASLLAIIVFTVFVPFSQAALWYFLIQVNVENGTVFPGDDVTISGQVTDQAGKPINDAQVRVRTGQYTTYDVTNENGEFRVILNSFTDVPGNYQINVIAVTADGKTGIATTEFQVKGDVQITTSLEKKLATPEAIKYLNSNPEDYEKDPVGKKLYEYYQDLWRQYEEMKRTEERISESELYIMQQKAIAHDLKEKAIEKRNPGAGTYSGNVFLESLDPSIRDIFAQQINYTKSLFSEAQQTKSQVLAEGGSEEQAKKAYMEKMTITKESLEGVGYIDSSNATNGNSTTTEIEPIVKTESISNTNSTNNEDTPLEIDLGTTNIQIGFTGTTFFLNVNGTVLKFNINGTDIIQITNSTE